MVITFLLIIISKEAATPKYLNLGQTGCTATGNAAYVNDDSSDVCSTSIPKVTPLSSGGFYPQNVQLTINVKEPGIYLGLENLANYNMIDIKQAFTDNSMTTIQAQNTNLNSEVIINDLAVISENANIKIAGQSGSTFGIKISSISIFQSASLYLEDVEYTDLYIYMYADFQLTDLIKTYTPELLVFTSMDSDKVFTATDQNQILDGKNVGFININYEYVGKEGFSISQVTYFGTTTIKKINTDSPKVQIDGVLLLVNYDMTLTEFFDADVGELQVNGDTSSSGTLTLTVGDESSGPVFFPITDVQNVQISSPGKIEVSEGCTFKTTNLIGIDCFTGSTKIVYQIVQGRSDIAIAYIYKEDVTDVEFHQGFLDFPVKMISSTASSVKIKSTHFRGITQLGVNMICTDSNCQIDCQFSTETKLYDSNNNEKQPEYFKIINSQKGYEFTPTKYDVTNFNDFSVIGTFRDIVFHKFSGNERTLYRFAIDFYANSIVFDENIDIQFDCNVFVTNSLQIPTSSRIIESSDSGAYVLIKEKFVTIDKIGPNYARKYNKLLFLDFSNIQLRDITVQNIGSNDNELNTLSFIFGDDDRMNDQKPLNIQKITACRGAYLRFQAWNVVVSENSAHIDKTTLLINPKFSAIALFQMGFPDNKDVYVYSNMNNLRINAQDFTNLFIDGYFGLVAKTANQEVNIENLYVNGQFLANNINIKTTNLMINQVQTPDSFPSVQIENDTYASISTPSSIIESIESPKLVLSGMEPESEIKINGKQLDITTKSTSYSFDTTKHGKVIFYLPHANVPSDTTASSSETTGNKVSLSVDQKGSVPHKVMDFNVVTDNEYESDSQVPASLAFEIDDSFPSQFEGNFAYAFDRRLSMKVLYIKKSTGEITGEKPASFPIRKCRLEPFYDEDEDMSDDCPSEVEPTNNEDSSIIDSSDDDSSNDISSITDSSDDDSSNDDSSVTDSSDDDSSNDDSSATDSSDDDYSNDDSSDDNSSINDSLDDNSSNDDSSITDSLNNDFSVTDSSEYKSSYIDSSNDASSVEYTSNIDSETNEHNTIEITTHPIVLPFETPKPLIPVAVSVENNEINTSNLVENDKEYIATIEDESNLLINGNGNTNLYLNVTNNVEIEETSAAFGIKVDKTSNPTVTLKQDEVDMNIKGNGKLHISTNKDIKTLKLGDILVSHGDKLNLHIDEEITLVEFDNLNLFGISTFEFNPTKVVSQVHVNNIYIHQGADGTVSNVFTKNKLEIKPNAFVLFNNVNLENIQITIYTINSNNLRSLISGNFVGVPSSIEVIPNPNGMLEEQVLYVASAPKNNFQQCEEWKKVLDYSKTSYKSCECKDEKDQKILYLSTKEQPKENSSKGKGLSVGAIAGIVIGVIAAVAIIVIVVLVVIKEKSKGKGDSEACVDASVEEI